MSEYKPYNTKYLRINLTKDSKNLIVRRPNSYRQKSLDKKLGRDRTIPYFPVRIASLPGSIDSEEVPEMEPIYTDEHKSGDDRQTRFNTDENSSKTGRFTHDGSYSTDKSSAGGKKIAINDSSYLLPKVCESLFSQ